MDNTYKMNITSIISFSQRTWNNMENAVDMKLIVALIAVLGVGTVAKLISWWLHSYRIKKLCLGMRHRCQKALDNLADNLSHNGQINKEQQSAITSLSFSELQAKLKSGEYAPTQVLEAYQHKALEVHKKTNCLQEPIVEAQEMAQQLELGDNKDLPLYGIPISIKDRYGLEGYEYTVGLTKLIGQRSKEDCVLIKVLKQQGAVPFVRTNVPQTLMAFESSNPIFGVTCNPHNKERGAGGSSGGEGALIGGGGSVLGLGSDIAGSIRMPSAFCGVYGLKPTMDRLSRARMVLPSGQTHVSSVFGPMATEVEGLVALMRAALTPIMFKLDPMAAPVPFNEETYGDKRPLKIGYYIFDGAFHPVPSCERAVMETVHTLRQLGHEVVEWDFAKYGKQIMPLYFSSVFGDGGMGYMKKLKGEKVDQCMRLLHIIFSMNGILSKILTMTVGRMYPNFATLMKARGLGSVSEWWDLGVKNRELIEEILGDWMSQGFDVVLSPGFNTPALPHGLPGICPVAMSTTLVYNFIRCPAGSMPVSQVKKKDLEQMDRYPTPDPWHRMIKKAQSGSEGLPVSVQIAGLPWQDELCLRVMKELETALKQ